MNGNGGVEGQAYKLKALQKCLVNIALYHSTEGKSSSFDKVMTGGDDCGVDSCKWNDRGAPVTSQINAGIPKCL